MVHSIYTDIFIEVLPDFDRSEWSGSSSMTNFVVLYNIALRYSIEYPDFLQYLLVDEQDILKSFNGIA